MMLSIFGYLTKAVVDFRCSNWKKTLPHEPLVYRRYICFSVGEFMGAYLWKQKIYINTNLALAGICSHKFLFVQKT